MRLRPVDRRLRCRCVGLLFALLTGLLFGRTASSAEPLRPAVANQATVQPPPGWKSVDRATYEAYAAALSSGTLGQTSGGLDRCDYRFRLLDDGSLVGEASGRLNLTTDPAWLPLGRPSFAISDVLVDRQQAIWGADPQGISCVWCPRDDAELQFQWTQQGLRRGDTLEFALDWPAAVANRIELTVPPGKRVETQGLLKISTVTDPDGTRLTFQAGARSGCLIRIIPEVNAPPQQFGMDLRQTLSATSTNVLIQSVVGIISPTAGPAVAEVELPARFTLLRATMGGDERLPVETDIDRKDLVRIPLGDLSPGQRIELRLVLERPADWSRPFKAPRVAPRNGNLLREEWVLQVEKPLELVQVEAPDYVMTSLSADPAREVWVYQGVAANGSLTLTARSPAAEWSADYFVRRRQQGPRTEILTLIDLRAIRTPLFEFDVEILKPWKIVSVAAPDSAGTSVPLSFRLLGESEAAARHRILLRAPATPQGGILVTIACAAQSPEAAPLHPVAIPVGGEAQGRVLLSKSDEQEADAAGLGPAIPLTTLRPALRSSTFFEAARSGALTIRPISKPATGVQETSLSDQTTPASDPQSRRIPVLPPKSLEEAQAVAELQSLFGSTGLVSNHRALFVFDEPVDASGMSVAFNGEWTFIEALCDGTTVAATALEKELRFPKLAGPVREIIIRYSTPSAVAGIPARERVVWPQLPSSVQRWTWRIECPPERRVTEVDTPFEFASGFARRPLRERLLAPLGRPSGVGIFNPFQASAWRDLLAPMGVATQPATAHESVISVTGSIYPDSTGVVAWSAPFLDSLNWVLLIGGGLGIVILRRFRRRTFRFAASLAAIAATCAWLLPPPFGSMAGALLCGTLLAYCIPRRLLSSVPAGGPRAANVSMGRLAGAMGLLVACLPAAAGLATAQVSTVQPNVLLLQEDEFPAPSVLVSEAVDRDIAAWQRERVGPAFLIRNARCDVHVDDSDLAAAQLEFEIVVPRPDLTRSIQLPFEGLTFRGPDAVRVNSKLARLVPTADGTGMIVPLPEEQVASGEPASFRIEMQAVIRIPAGGARRDFALMMPRCNSALGVIHSAGATIRDFQSSARGRTLADSNMVTCALGATARWSARWRGSDALDRANSEPGVTARAESVVTAQPQSLLVQSRLLFETPELADPFASLRLVLDLPAGSIVTSVAGQSLIQWRTRAETDAVRLLLDFAGPPIVGQSVDFSFELPVKPSATMQIPPIPLLPPLQLSSHQVALITAPVFQLEMLTKADPDSGLWAVEPSEASFSLRKDRGLPIPGSAIELETPQPIVFELKRRPIGRTAELEQTLTSATDSIAWTGTARVETSVRPGFLYELHIDPAIEITAASVIERDVERLSRFLRDGDRLLLIVGDDRLGTKNIRLDGRLNLQAGKVRPTPLFNLENAIVTRHECVVTSTADQLLQIRRRGAASLIVGRGDTEWEPLSPSSRRVALLSGDSGYEMRWINPANPLKVVEYLQLPADGGNSACSMEWRLQSREQLPATLSVNAPRGTLIDDSSDYVEEGRRLLQSDRVRIELQSKSSRPQDARILLTAPMHSSIGESGVLPHLTDLSVSPVTYLAVPRSLLPACEIPGGFLDELPPGAPASWPGPFATRALLVFKLSGNTWRVTTTGQHGSVAEATAEVVRTESSESIRGQTRLVISPRRVGILQIEPTPGGEVTAVRGCAGALLERSGPHTWQLLLRPSEPVALIVDWSASKEQGASPDPVGIVTPGLDVHLAYLATVPPVESTRWTPDFLSRPRDTNQLVAARLESLLAAARRLPIGIQPPTWLREELLTLGRASRNTSQLADLSLQAESLLDSWSARSSTTTAPNSVAPEASRLTRLPQQLLAEGMFVAAADPDAVVEIPRSEAVWSISRKVFNGAFASAWFIFWTFLVTKGGQWSARHQLADRLASHPGIVLLAIGTVWWLLLAPSAFGALLAAAGAVWEFVFFLHRRQLRPAQPAAADPS